MYITQVFADDETSQKPLTVPRAWIWNLQRRNLLCGANASTIFSGKRIIAPCDLYKLNQFYLSSKFWLTMHFFFANQVYQQWKFRVIFGKVCNDDSLH